MYRPSTIGLCNASRCGARPAHRFRLRASAVKAELIRGGQGRKRTPPLAPLQDASCALSPNSPRPSPGLQVCHHIIRHGIFRPFLYSLTASDFFQRFRPSFKASAKQTMHPNKSITPYIHTFTNEAHNIGHKIHPQNWSRNGLGVGLGLV
jgi:hypothetical protein